MRGDERDVKSNVIAQTLRDAATYVETHGLARFEFVDPNGRVCIVGALIRAIDPEATCVSSMYLRNPAAHQRLLAARGYLHAVLGPGSVTHWSDALGRTKEEVATVLRHAALLAEGESSTIL